MRVQEFLRKKCLKTSATLKAKVVLKYSITQLWQSSGIKICVFLVTSDHWKVRIGTEGYQWLPIATSRSIKTTTKQYWPSVSHFLTLF